MIEYLLSTMAIPKYDPKTPHTCDDMALRMAFYAGQKQIIDKLTVLSKR